MMKVLIIGDTHGQDDIFLRVLSREKGFDVLLHTGDFEGSEFVYSELTEVPFYFVAGNNDFFTDAPFEQVIELAGCRIFMTHGHKKNLFLGYKEVLQEAARRRAVIAVFGHSHLPVAEYQKGILLLNPGSLTWPRQENGKPSYIVLSLSEGRVDSFEIRYLQ